ncbi:uncharacterized protein LOC124182233 isoform X2 [Neodiprion fabricii]|uniref:uncharacterized protein LOC124182233 isoform X2 n=1 Tax=Neodiprion fabricii TaxID=2872261 RepID=UPI001ED9805A|nr:uncharacterized protein LOC124182233 isoform X2 [Neodiprion fabricii]
MLLFNGVMIYCLLATAFVSRTESQRTSQRRNSRQSRTEGGLDFECPEEFGYYPHPHDCTQYYVCVFGGALLESCTGGLMYSNELQTCDWPRNVGCVSQGGERDAAVKDVERIEEEPQLVRASKVESVPHQRHSRPTQRQQVATSKTSSVSPPVTERQLRQKPQPQPTYSEEEYEPASEVESDRQQRVYRGQPSTIGQVQRDRDGLRRNVISNMEREKDILLDSRNQPETFFRPIQTEPPRIVQKILTTPVPIISKSPYFSEPDQSYHYYPIYDDDVSLYKDDVDYNQYSLNQSDHIVSPTPNIRVTEVSVSPKSYTQRPKKVDVNDADKYSVNQDVTVQDYDIYDTQADLNRNKFRISDGQQVIRNNVISHSAGIITTPNVVIETHTPTLTTTTTPIPTTERPVSVTVPTRSRSQVNRGTAPPRSRPTLKPSTQFVSKAQEFVDIYKNLPTRPEPVYPTPQVDKPAAKCRKDVCLLPDCNCGGPDIPGGLLPEEIPQLVILTFDDAVNELNKQLYTDLFENDRLNPNGCPIAATFYVSHEWTDYSQVQNLYAAGHEMASHTVSHSFGEQFSHRKWAREVAGQREILAAYGGVRLDDIKGMRAPFLSVGGNNMFKMLWDMNFTYDSSMPIYENRPPSWPYTLDYKLFHDCMIPPCPTRSYPGLWEVPMVMWQDLNGGRCSMGDACSNPPTADGVYKMLIKNFERHYTTNRAPFGLFYHAAWFTQAHHKEGFISFLDTIVAMDDVWLVTNTQAIEWVRNPTPTTQLANFEPFQCNYQGRPKKCNNPKVCNLWHKSGVRYMKTCQPCPDIYPWTGKSGIRSSRIDNEVETHE